MEKQNLFHSLPVKYNGLKIEKLLGKGKSGYSFLASSGSDQFIVKRMHYEPCPYYDFDDNKVKLEIKAYKHLQKLGIPIPELYEYDIEHNIIIKEYIDGQVGSELIAAGDIDDEIFSKLFKFHKICKKNKTNIDYFPTNFVISDNGIFYIDYEINPYMPEWDLLNWGIYYWINSDGMKKYLETDSIKFLNKDIDSGVPIKKPFEKKKKKLVKKFLK